MTLEIRGRGNSWKVYYPNESKLGSPVQIYDRDGNLKDVLWCGSPDDGMTEAHFVGSQAQALEYAEYLCPGMPCRVVRKLTPKQCLQKARKARAA
jgi:hypothetical protein